MRYCVTLEPEELPWALRFYFLRSYEDGKRPALTPEDIDEGAWVNVGFEMGIGAVRRGQDVDDSAIISASNVRWIQENFFHYRAIAESRLNTDRVVPPGPHGGTTPEALAYLATRYRDLEGNELRLKILEAEFRASRTTIWRRLKRAGVTDDQG